MFKRIQNKNLPTTDHSTVSSNPQKPRFLARLSSILKKTFRNITKKIKQSNKNQRVFGAIIFVLIVVVSGFLISSRFNTTNNQGSTATKTRAKPELKTPDYPTLLPAGKTIEELGGWTRVSPNDRNPVFAYVDVIGKSPINVSQQPLPDSLKPDTDVLIADLAKGFQAKEEIAIGETIAYVGTSNKGPQSVIYYRDNLLILIKSTLRLTTEQWSAYLNNLQ